MPPDSGWEVSISGHGQPPRLSNFTAQGGEVTGCGMPEFNGVYVRDGDKNGSPKFRKAKESELPKGQKTSKSIKAEDVKARGPGLHERVVATVPLWLSLEQARAVLTPTQLADPLRGAADDFTDDDGGEAFEDDVVVTPGMLPDELEGLLTLIKQSPAMVVQVQPL